MTHVENQMGNLKQRILHGGSWMLFSRVVIQILSLLRTAVTARILVPEDFGLLGIAVIVVAFIERVTTVNLNLFLMQKTESIHEDIDTIWTIGVLKGIFFYGIIFFSAPFVVGFFGTPGAVNVLRVIALVFVINSFVNGALVYLQKNMEMEKLSYSKIVAAIVETGVTLGMVFLLRNVWAIIFGTLASYLTNMLMSFLIYPRMPRLEIKWEKLKDCFLFGKWLYFGKMTAYCIQYGDNATVGKMMGQGALGLYQMAYRLGMLPFDELSQALNNIVYPVYIKLKTEDARLKKFFLKSIEWQVAVIIPLVIMMVFFSKGVVSLLLGDKWLNMVVCFQIIAIVGFFKHFHSHNGLLLLAKGKPQVAAWGGAIQLVIMGALIIPLTLWMGIEGAATAVLLGTFIAALFSLFMAFKEVRLRITDLGSALAGPLCACIFMSLVLWGFSWWIAAHAMGGMVVGMGLSLFVYLGVLLLFDHWQAGELLIDLRKWTGWKFLG